MVISVGNLGVGGNGKTPMVEYIIRLLSPQYQVATLSRGYGRSTNGFKLAAPNHSAADIGDEPLQIYRKFQPEIVVAVGESRALAIPKILFEKPEVDVVILDDAFQHRSVMPQFSILVTDYRLPFFKDHLLPSGTLREPREGVRRADVVVVTKCPDDLGTDQRQLYIDQIHKFHQVPVFFATIRYSQPVHFKTGQPFAGQAEVLLVTGIAKPETMVEYVSNCYTLAGHLKFRDHYNFGKKQLGMIRDRFSLLSGASRIILTSEKDMVRLLRFKSELQELPLYYLPIEMGFLDGQHHFDELVLNSIEGVE
jgi:tetraacyldisaccharide 4'-kinase